MLWPISPEPDFELLEGAGISAAPLSDPLEDLMISDSSLAHRGDGDAIGRSVEPGQRQSLFWG
jgi:hypothetical protein